MHKQILLSSFLILFILPSLWGQVEYAEIIQSELIPMHFNAMDFADVDNDGDTDFIMAGFEVTGDYRTNLYLNDGSGRFTKVLGTNFPPVFEPSIHFVDLNGDSYNDLFISGTDSADEGYITLYLNDGTGNFTQLPASNLPDLPPNGFNADFSDVDNDGDQDLCLIGGDFISVNHAQVYFNNGTGLFSESNNLLQEVASGTVDFSDIDNDGDPDLLISGFGENLIASTKLYENDGTGNFVLLNSSNLVQLGLSAVAFADIDGDDDQDFILSGLLENFPSGTAVTAVYKNDGTGVFTEDTDNFINELNFNSIAFGDVDGDNDNDLLLSGGANWSSTKMTSLFLNDGTGIFSEILNDFFEPISLGTAVLEEISGDDKIDIIFSGRHNSSQALSIIKVYENQEVLDINNPLTNDLILSHSYHSNGLLEVQLDKQYKTTDVTVYNILGQVEQSHHYTDVKQFQLSLKDTMQIKIVVIRTDKNEVAILKLVY